MWGLELGAQPGASGAAPVAPRLLAASSEAAARGPSRPPRAGQRPRRAGSTYLGNFSFSFLRLCRVGCTCPRNWAISSYWALLSFMPRTAGPARRREGSGLRRSGPRHREAEGQGLGVGGKLRQSQGRPARYRDSQGRLQRPLPAAPPRGPAGAGRATIPRRSALRSRSGRRGAQGCRPLLCPMRK